MGAHPGADQDQEGRVEALGAVSRWAVALPAIALWERPFLIYLSNIKDVMLRLVVMARRRSHILRLATCAVLIVATAACGGDSRPTTPVSPTPLSPQPQIPNVAGTYQGPLTITAASAGGAVMVSLSGTMQLTVVQAGAQLTTSTRPAPSKRSPAPWTTPAASRSRPTPSSMPRPSPWATTPAAPSPQRPRC